MSARPRIIAHRGGPASWPHSENSLPAFRAAYSAGFTSECDVWASSDGQPIVIHDETLDRTTTAKGLVSQYTAHQLTQIPLKFKQNASTLQTLDGVADLVSFVEIKPPNSRELVQCTIQVMHGRDWTLMAFDPRNLEYALEFDRTTKVVLLVDDLESLARAIQRRWIPFLDHRLSESETVNRLRQAGLTFGTWTVNTVADLKRIYSLDPIAIITDHPLMLEHSIE